MGFFLGSKLGSKIVFGSTHVANQLLFSIVSSILTFDFDLIFGLYFYFLGPNGLFLGSMWGLKTVLGSTNVVEQFSFFSFWGPNRLFLGLG